MDEIVKTVLWSAPLSAVLVSALIWLIRSWIIERLSNAIKHEYNKDLEEHKAKLKGQFDMELEIRKAALKAQSDAELEVHKANAQRLIHIDKSHFDMEFDSFKTLWSAVSSTVDHTARVLRLYSFTELSAGKGEKRKYAEVADKSFFEASQITQRIRPFIPGKIHELARELEADCKREINQFFYDIKMEETPNSNYEQDLAAKSAKDALDRILGDWHALADAIQQRLAAIPGEQTKHA